MSLKPCPCGCGLYDLNDVIDNGTDADLLEHMTALARGRACGERTCKELPPREAPYDV